MKRNKMVALSVLLVLSSLYFGCGENKGNTALKDQVVNIKVEKVKQTDGTEAISYSGTIEESDTYPLSFSSIGTVSKVLVSEGDYVKQGQLLAVLDETSYKNSYEMSLATLQRAEDAFKRLKPMYENGNLPEIKYVEVQSALQQAKAATEIAKKGLNDCKLYSPVSGVVANCSIDPGLNTMPSIASIKIVKIGTVYAKIYVSENEISLFKKGDKATVQISALKDAQFTGTVEEIGVSADPIAHTYKVKIQIPNSDYIIKPGMLCEANILNQSETTNLFVPTRSILVNEQGKNFIYVVKNNKAIKKYVALGDILNNGIAVSGNIKEGEFVVVEGFQKLVDNSNVTIIN